MYSTTEEEEMEATKKALPIDEFITAMTGKDRKATVRAGGCMTCGGAAVEFRDELSVREYRISGMCQKCQDSVFGG